MNALQAYLLIDTPDCVLSLGPVKNRLPERLGAVVRDLDISQAEAARQCGLSPARFHNYLSGFRTPDLDTLMRIAKKLGVTTDYLLGLSSDLPELAEVVRRLLELEGMEPVRAGVVADTAQEALQLLLALPAEGDARTRSRIAAQAAWRQRGAPRPLQ